MTLITAITEDEVIEAQERAEELKKDLAERTATAEKARQLIEEANLELQKVKEQKELEPNENATKLADLEKIVQELQKPKPNWFQKLFVQQ